MKHDIMIQFGQKWALRFGPLYNKHPPVLEKKRAAKVHNEHKTYQNIKHN